MRHLFLFLVPLGLLGCGPAGPTARTQHTPDSVSADSLCMVYVNRNHAYDGRLIEVRIKSGEYAIRHRAIHCGRCGAEELIRFEVDTPPKDTTCDLIVTGTCRGAVRDGVVRCEDPRIDWYVLVERCSVTVLSP